MQLCSVLSVMYLSPVIFLCRVKVKESDGKQRNFYLTLRWCGLKIALTQWWCD